MAKPAKELTATELAELFGFSVATVTNWKAEGLPFRTKNGRPVYVPAVAVKWLRDEESRKAREAAGAPDKAIEEARKMRAQADMAEIERDLMVGALVRRESVEAEQLKENIRARTILLAVPNAHAQRLADELGVPPRAIAKALDATMRAVLTELADENDERVYHESPEVAT